MKNTKTNFIESLLRLVIKKLESEDDCSELEKEVSEIINGALLHPDTRLMTNIEEKKYLIENTTLHLTISINQNSAMIRITNTVHNTTEKYRIAFVDKIVLKIIEDYNKKMNKILDQVDDTILVLIKNTNSMIKIANGDVEGKIKQEVDEFIKEA
jgi:hypothetical protein